MDDLERSDSSTITRSELVERLAQAFPQLLPRDVELAVKTLLDTMSQALAEGKRIELRGFGSFVMHHRPPRQGRNPKSSNRAKSCVRGLISQRKTTLKNDRFSECRIQSIADHWKNPYFHIFSIAGTWQYTSS